MEDKYYLVKQTDIVSSAKEDMDGETTLFIDFDITDYAQHNHCFQRSEAYVDSYIGSEPKYEWIEIQKSAADKYQEIINHYNELLQLKMVDTIPGMVFKDCGEDWEDED